MQLYIDITIIMTLTNPFVTELTLLSGSITEVQAGGEPVTSLNPLPTMVQGFQYNGSHYTSARISEMNALFVEDVGSNSAFGEKSVSHMTPIMQIDAVYGLKTTDVETQSGSSGACTSSGSLFIVSTGASNGGLGIIRSKKFLRYMPGQGARIRFTAMFTTPVADSLQLAGMFSAQDGMFFGYKGTEFGVLRRIAGAADIKKLTMTVGTGGAPETVTITLNGTSYDILMSASLTPTQLCDRLVKWSGSFNDWSSEISPNANSTHIKFIQETPATVAGVFSITSTGTASGSFSTLQAGCPNDDITGFIPQSQWNIDKMDGTSGSYNPSGMLLDPTKLNVFEIVYPYLGAGPVQMRIMPTWGGRYLTAHRIDYPNLYTIPNQKNPSMRVGWIAKSLGSTTNLLVKGGSAGGFVDGEIKTTRDPNGFSVNKTVTSTDSSVVCLRVRGEFSNVVNQRELYPHTLAAGVEESNRLVILTILLNPNHIGDAEWAYYDEENSCIEYSTTTATSHTGGRQIASVVVAGNNAREIELHELGVKMEPGDTITILARTVSATATLQLSINWYEI